MDTIRKLAKREAEADYLRRRVEIKSLDDGGRFAGYAAVWDERDEAGDLCLAGCFAETLAEWKARGTLPRLKWRHGTTIGHITDAQEDDHGLRVEGRIWNAPVAAEIRSAIDGGQVVGMSFAFVAIDYDLREGVRYLARVELMDDVTITLRPVNTSAEVLEVKSDDSPLAPSERTTEGILRDAGFSRRQAKRMLAGGYSALRDADGPTRVVLAGILETLKKI